MVGLERTVFIDEIREGELCFLNHIVHKLGAPDISPNSPLLVLCVSKSWVQVLSPVGIRSLYKSVMVHR